MGRFYQTQECQPQQQECQPINYCDSGNQCGPSYGERQMSYGTCRPGGECASGSDGFAIVQSKFESPEAYNAAVSGAFQYTEQNYGQALRDAAAKGQPVIAVFGGENVPNSKAMIEDIKRAQQEGVNATYVYIDMGKLAQNPSINPALAAYVDGNIRGHNSSHAMMFAQKPDANGNPVPERNIMSTWGGIPGNVEMFKNQIDFGYNAMKGREFNVKPSDAGTAPADQAAPKKSNAEILKEVQAGIEAGKKASDWHQGSKEFQQAIKAADSMQPEVNASLEAATKELAAAKAAGDVARTAELDTKIAELQKYKDAASQARMEYGFQMMKWNPAFKGIGEKWLMAAGDKNPGMYEDPNFSARMKEAGYSTAAELDFAARMQERDHERQRKAAVGPNSQTPAENQNLPPDRQQFSQPRAIMRPNPNGPNPGEFRPAVNPETTPPEQRQRPPEQRPQPERERERPTPDDTRSTPRLTVIEHHPKSPTPRAEVDEAEYAVLAKAADEHKQLKTVWGKPGCQYCPDAYTNFEGSANKDQNVYYSNHNFFNSTLARQLGIHKGVAPQHHNWNVSRVSDTDFRLTDHKGNSVTVSARRKR